jgi:hypothetical protein
MRSLVSEIKYVVGPTDTFDDFNMYSTCDCQRTVNSVFFIMLYLGFFHSEVIQALTGERTYTVK